MNNVIQYILIINTNILNEEHNFNTGYKEGGNQVELNMANHVTWCHTTWHNVTPRDMMSHHVTWRHTAARDMTSHYVTWRQTKWHIDPPQMIIAQQCKASQCPLKTSDNKRRSDKRVLVFFTPLSSWICWTQTHSRPQWNWKYSLYVIFTTRYWCYNNITSLLVLQYIGVILIVGVTIH